MRHCGPYLDASDGLIDGQLAGQVLDAVMGQVATVLCRELRGLHDDDPRLRAILARGRELQELRRGGASQSTVLEAAFTWCAQQFNARALTGLLDELEHRELSVGGKGLRVVHGQRTLTAEERPALMIEAGGWCVEDGCCPAQPDPPRPLRPHHVLGFAEDQITSLEESILLCDRLHADLHTGQRTVQLRDGRRLNVKASTTEPTIHDQPPF